MGRGEIIKERANQRLRLYRDSVRERQSTSHVPRAFPIGTHLGSASTKSATKRKRSNEANSARVALRGGSEGCISSRAIYKNRTIT